MFWLKEYCKNNNLIIVGKDIYENSTIIGEINFYDELVKFTGQDYLYKFGDFALGLIEKEEFHKEKI